MFTVFAKEGQQRFPTNKQFTVADVSYDTNGYPLFLVFYKNQWLRVKAKYFEPFEWSLTD